MPTVLVTGANRGIGLAFANEYLRRGWQVLAACRQPEHADRLRAHPEFSQRLRLLRMDVSSERSIAEAIDSVELTGGIDLLINNAGIYLPGASATQTPRDALIESFVVNCAGPCTVLRLALPLLERGSLRKVVNITMPTRPIGHVQGHVNAAYAASRYALNLLTRMSALELAPRGIRVYALWPGYLSTDMNGHAADAQDPALAIPPVVDLIDRVGDEASGRCLMPDGSHFEW